MGEVNTEAMRTPATGGQGCSSPGPMKAAPLTPKGIMELSEEFMRAYFKRVQVDRDVERFEEDLAKLSGLADEMEKREASLFNKLAENGVKLPFMVLRGPETYVIARADGGEVEITKMGQPVYV